MAYDKRHDGRDWLEPRPIIAKAGVIKKADGSGYFKIGKTEAYAAVYGPRELHPKFMQDPKRGVLRCNYNMMPFSGAGERVKPGPSRRSKEISMVTAKALLPVVNLDDFPNAVVDVFIELPQTDAGSRCAGICAAAIALADAGIQMKDMVSAFSVGKVEDKLMVDLDYDEEAWGGHSGNVADVPVAMVPSTGEITLLQMDGKISKEELIKAIDQARPIFAQIAEIQRQAIKDKFDRWGRGEE
ncbi:TPA: exosome complex exonuclease Rrp41 [Candidatus Woesearchaeota archaeon]|nr:exosome complex exonuclease Rrp41 [Candidatus Woesearchaeota archaeon]